MKFLFFLIVIFLPSQLFSDNFLMKFENQYHSINNLDNSELKKIDKAKARLKFRINYPKTTITKNDKSNYFFESITNENRELDFKLINSKVIFYLSRDTNNEIHFDFINLRNEDLFSLTNLFSTKLNDSFFKRKSRSDY